jgi:hypothetical protein
VENYWHLGRWFGVPVSMHWTVLLAFPWLWLWTQSVVMALIGLGAYVLLLIVHELGHTMMARWRGLGVHDITLNGLHGETSHDYPRNERDDILIAWSGVGAQAIVLLLALAVTPLLRAGGSAWIGYFSAPVLMVFTLWNMFLMIVALLPIGPMDGHRAWRLIPYLRKSAARRGGGGKVVKLDAARRRKLEQNSEQIATDILNKLNKKK